VLGEVADELALRVCRPRVDLDVVDLHSERGGRLAGSLLRLAGERHRGQRAEKNHDPKSRRHTASDFDYTGLTVYKLNNYTKGFVVQSGKSGLLYSIDDVANSGGSAGIEAGWARRLAALRFSR